MDGLMFCDALRPLPLIGMVLALVSPAWAQYPEQKLTASDGAEDDLFGVVSISGNHAAVGAPEDDDRGSNSGAVYVFELQGDGSWLEVVKLTASDGGPVDRFGTAVSLSGDRIVVGAYNDEGAAGGFVGSAYVFERQESGSWLEVAKLTASDGDEADRFGISVSISGDRVLVGAYHDDDEGSDSGSAYVFERQGDGSWIEEAKLTASDGNVGHEFGISVSVSGPRAVVGAHQDDDLGFKSGSAYVFFDNGDSANGNGDETWFEVAKLTASDGESEDFFGISVALSGDRALVGAIGPFFNRGAVYVYREGDGSWMEVDKLMASDGSTGDEFGNSVSISGDRIVVGASRSDAPDFLSGSAYVYTRQEDESWLEVGKLTASDGAGLDLFGGSVSISGDRVVVGALGDDDLGENSGSAYVYEVFGSPPTEAPDLLSPDEGAVFESGDVTFSWTPIVDAAYYAFELSPTSGFESPVLTTVTDTSLVLGPPDIPVNHADPFYWRVRVGSELGEGPNSTVRSFTYYIFVSGWVGDGGGIIEVTYAGDADTCPDPSNPNDYGCTELPGDGNTTWHDGNLNDDYYVSAGGGSGDLDRINRYIEAVNSDDFEIRFTSTGGLAVYGLSGFEIASVPFEIWNSGETPDDPVDDIRMIPFLNVNSTPLANWANQYTGTDVWSGSPCSGGCPITDWVYLMMPDRPNGYDLFEQAAIGFGGPGAVYDRISDGDTQIDIDPYTGLDCANQGVYVDYCYENQDFIFNPGPSSVVYPLGRVVFADLNGNSLTPPVDTIVRFTSMKPIVVADEPGPPVAEPPQTYALLSIYPNPFNPRAIVPFVVPKAVHIRLTVVDILGRQVATLLDGYVVAGHHEALLDGGNLVSGVYLVRLETEGIVRATQKALFLR